MTILIGCEIEAKPNCLACSLNFCDICDPYQLLCFKCSLADVPYYCSEFCQGRIKERKLYCLNFTSCRDCPLLFASYCLACDRASSCERKGEDICRDCEEYVPRSPYCIFRYSVCTDFTICKRCEKKDRTPLIHEICSLCDPCERCRNRSYPIVVKSLREEFNCGGKSNSCDLDQDIIYCYSDQSCGVEIVTKPTSPEDLIRIHSWIIDELKEKLYFSPSVGAAGHLTLKFINNYKSQPIYPQLASPLIRLVRVYLPVLLRNSCEEETTYRDPIYREIPIEDEPLEKYQAVRFKPPYLVEFRYPDSTTNSALFRKSVYLAVSLLKHAILSEKSGFPVAEIGYDIPIEEIDDLSRRFMEEDGAIVEKPSKLYLTLLKNLKEEFCYLEEFQLIKEEMI